MKYENWQAFELVKLYFRIPHPLLLVSYKLENVLFRFRKTPYLTCGSLRNTSSEG